MKKIYPKKENYSWVHDFLDDQSAKESENQILNDQNIVKNEDDLVVNAGLNEKYAHDFDSGEAWQEFQKQVKKEKRFVLFRSSLLKYAAILAVPVLIGSVVYFLNKTDLIEVSNQIAKQDKPRNKVELILNDGSSVNLQEAQTIKGLNGVELGKQNNVLDYTKVEANKELNKVVYNTLVVPKGADYKLILEDGTQIWVNADTKIRYQVNMDNTEKREVYLEGGEAFFKVTRNEKKPFIVHNGGMDVQVLGTSFNINAYSETKQTTLVEGKVEVKVNNGSNIIQLTPGQQAEFNKLTGTLTKQEVDVFPFVAWKEGVLACNNTSLDALMEQVGRLYDYDIEFINAQAKQLHFNGRMEKTATVNELLDIIQKTTNVKFTIKDRRILIEK